MRWTVHTGDALESIGDLRHAWQLGLDSINEGRASWAENPWVWAISFRLL